MNAAAATDENMSCASCSNAECVPCDDCDLVRNIAAMNARKSIGRSTKKNARSERLSCGMSCCSSAASKQFWGLSDLLFAFVECSTKIYHDVMLQQKYVMVAIIPIRNERLRDDFSTNAYSVEKPSPKQMKKL